MSTISFPFFEEQEILTHTKLNEFIASLEDKFTSGITGVELDWPLIAQGNINMGVGAEGHSILNGKAVFKVVNALGFDTFEDAVTDAGAGGAVFIPPETTITTEGLTLPAGFTIFGSGPSSVLRVAAGGTALLTTAAAASVGLTLFNLTLDGNSVAGQTGVALRSVTNVRMFNVTIGSFDTSGITIASNCSNISIQNCVFASSGSHHISGDAVARMRIDGCRFVGTTAGSAVRIVPSATGSARDIYITDCTFADITGEPVIDIQGRTALSDSYANITVRGCAIDATLVGATNFAVQLGTTTNPLRNVTCTECVIDNADYSGGIRLNAEGAAVSGNQIRGTGTAGIDLDESTAATVTGNTVGTLTVGIDAEDATGIVATGNTVTSPTTPIVFGDNANIYRDNYGLPHTWWSGTAAPYTVTLPAGRLAVGDVLNARRYCVRDGGTGGTLRFFIQGNAIGACYAPANTNGDEVGFDAKIIVVDETTLHVSAALARDDTVAYSAGFYGPFDLTSALTCLSSNAEFPTVNDSGLLIEHTGRNGA